MTKLITVFLFLFFNAISWAQSVDHPSTGQGILFETHDSFITPTEDKVIHYIPLTFHLIVDNNSMFNDTTHVDTMIALINSRFLAASIQFVKCDGVNFIQDPQMANSQDAYTIMQNLHATHSNPNTINIYIANTISNVGGYSFSGPSGSTGYTAQYNSILISGSQYLGGDEMIPPHELGHYFGLYHPSANSAALPELVDGTNCTSAGDYCCDTPAEYGGMCCAVLPACEFNPLFGIVTDSNGDTLVPDVTNIMSSMQYNTNCRDVFTPDQYDRIRYYRENYLTSFSCPSAVGLNENELVSFTIAPNPASSQLTVRCSSINEQFRVQIFDLMGKLMLQDDSIGGESMTMNVDELSPGSYLVRAIYDRGNKDHLIIIQ